MFFSVRKIIDRFVSLLKVQVGALSKFLHSHPDAREFSHLRQTTDRLIRGVAALGDEKTTDLGSVETVLEQVSDAYKQVRVSAFF